MRTRILAAAVTAAASLAAAGPAAAKPADYHGTTKEGTDIAFDFDGRWVDHIRSRVPTSCVSAQGGTPRVTIDSWEPAYAFRIGTRSTVKDESGYPTKHYTFSSHRVGSTIRGRLGLSYSRLLADDFGGYRILTCWGTANYTARVG